MHATQSAQDLAPGFAQPPLDAAACFRAALQAMARPGTVHSAAPAGVPSGLSPAASALALTLLDHETPVWLAPSVATETVRTWLAFHTGAPVTPRREDANFAIGPWDEMAPLAEFAVGTPEYPDRSATLIVEVADLGTTHRLTGPGIEDTAHLTHPDPAFARANAALFPCGIDLFLTAGDRLAAIPRTTRVEG
ncbi:MAG: phosphonate C-P lyase system protein PhnH [Pseudomonadota bacterium]